RAGDGGAGGGLGGGYRRGLVTLARQKLQGACRRAADEEDVVQNAFHSFFRGVSGGRFPQLHDRDNLWRLLVVITARKALDLLAAEYSKRRGGGTAGGESRISPGAAGADATPPAQARGGEPTPDLAAPTAADTPRT